MPETILIVDDEPSQLRHAGYAPGQPCRFHNIVTDGVGENIGRAVFAQQHPDLILLDVAARAKSPQVIRELKASRPQVPVIALVAYGDDEFALQLIKAGANDFLAKPVSLERLRLSVQTHLKMQRMVKAIARLERKAAGHVAFSDITGQSQPIKAAVALAEKAASSKIPVWIEGGQGAGKELFARAIHGGSDRAGKPFVVVDCRHLPEDNAQAVLFGGEKNNGHAHVSLGKLHAAEHGTLYFKDIDALAPELQQQLIEVLENSAADIRIICACRKNMETAIRAGTFSHMLYQRLRGMVITLPPLAERGPDIALLAQHFIGMHTATENKYIGGLTLDALRELEKNNWPGNVRQLENVLWRAVTLCSNDRLDAGTIRMVQQVNPMNYAGGDADIIVQQSPTFFDTHGQVKKLKSIEEEVIHFALQYSGGCMTRAARNLGIGRSTLYRRIGGTLSRRKEMA